MGGGAGELGFSPSGFWEQESEENEGGVTGFRHRVERLIMY